MCSTWYQCLLFILLFWTIFAQKWMQLPLIEDLYKSSEEQSSFPKEQYYSDINYYDSSKSNEDSVDDNELSYLTGNENQLSNSRDRRRQVTCEVIKTKEEFSEPGYEFVPSTYMNTTCIQRQACDPSFNENSDRKQFCVVRNLQCRTNFKEMTVFKRRTGHTSWHIYKIQKVAVGCCDHH